MRRILNFLFLFSILTLISSCGGSGTVNIDGPTLSQSEAEALVVDKFYANAGAEDEYSGKGEYSIYLRDAGTNKDIVCLSTDETQKISYSGIFYGGLSIPFTAIDGERPDESARFKVLFVEEDGKGCPSALGDDANITGVSAELTFEQLVGKTIWTTNGKAAVYLRGLAEESRSARDMAPSLEDGIFIDSLYFDNGDDGDKSQRYYIFIDEYFDGKSIFQCQLSDEDMAAIHFGDVIYSALNIPVTCFSPTDADFAGKIIKFSLFIQKENGTELVGETEPVEIGELIGEKIQFTNNKGFISFRSVVKNNFAADVLRLEELAAQKVTAIKYAEEAEGSGAIEVHLFDSDENFSVACAGTKQDFTNLTPAGEYVSLNASIVAVDGQKELFGYSKITAKLIERTDGLKCPDSPANSYRILGESDVSSIDDFLKGRLDFIGSDGYLGLSFF